MKSKELLRMTFICSLILSVLVLLGIHCSGGSDSRGRQNLPGDPEPEKPEKPENQARWMV